MSDDARVGLDEMDADERRLGDLFRQAEAPASMRRWDSAAAGGGQRWWTRLLLAPISAGGERRLRPLAAALVLPLLVLAVGGGMQLRAHFSSGTAGSGANPPARSDASMAFDAAHGVVVLFGGRAADGEGVLGDTWTWDGSGWTQQRPAQSPSPRSNAAMAFDVARGEVVLFGGTPRTSPGGNRQLENPTWTWDGSTWHQVTTAHTPDGQSAGMAYDAARDRLVLVTDSIFPVAEPLQAHAAPIGTLAPAGPKGGPTATHPPVAVAVPPTAIIGIGPSLPANQVQTWTWTGSDWKLQRGNAPSGWPNFSSVAWDAKAQRVVMLTDNGSGSVCAGTASGSFSSVQAVPPPASAGAAHGSAGWTGYSAAPPTPGARILPATPRPGWIGPTPPHPVIESPCMSLAERNVGSPQSGIHCAGCPLAQQWAWDGSTWRQTSLGDNVSFVTVSLAADPASGRLVAVDSNDTWTWNGSKWTPHRNPSSLHFRHAMALVADTAHNTVVLFGGRLGGLVDGDTWTWDGKSWTHRGGSAQAVPSPIAGVSIGGLAPQGCKGLSVDVVNGPAAGAVSINVGIGSAGGGCDPGGVSVTLRDAAGVPLKVSGNGQTVNGPGTITLLWTNWCGTRSGSVSLQRDNQGLTQSLDVFPACTQRGAMSVLALLHTGTLTAIP